MPNESSRNIISSTFSVVDLDEPTIRPKKLNDFIGHEQLRHNLSVYIIASKNRKDSLDHLLFYGPPGLGKTALSHIVANELSVNIRTTSGPILTKTGDLAAILTNLQEHDVLFIDEIHRLNIAIEEMLYSAMEDFHIDLIIGEGPAARTVRINLPKFTLIGATTRLGLLTGPLKDRFGIHVRLDFYSREELTKIIERGSLIMKTNIANDAALEIAMRARGTPRIAIRLLRRIRDFADVAKKDTIDKELVKSVLKKLQIDKMGLDELDYKYLLYIVKNYYGGPVGIDTITAALAEDRYTIEDTVEPYLMQIGFLNRTPRGRVLTQECMKHMGQCLI